MTDYLLELGANPQARRILNAIGFPLPLPEKLARDSSPWQAKPLAGKTVILGATPGSSVAPAVADILLAAGTTLHTGKGVTHADARSVQALAENARVHALVLDATGVDTIAGLRALYDFFHPLVGRLARSGRVVVLGRPSEEVKTAEGAAAQRGVEGFVRSVAKEIGRKGSTANFVVVSEGAEGRLAGVLRFLLSARSAFVTAQPIRVTAGAKDTGAPSFVKPLEGKTALVTGAARGIGAATAKLLAQEGARVICLDRPADADATQALARDIGGITLLVDLSEDDAPKRVAEEIAQLGGIDIVVNNAGITRDKTLARMKPEQWQSVIDVNLLAAHRITEALLPHLREGGRVIGLSSVAGIAGNVGQTAYAASKSAIIGWVRVQSKALADRGITVNAIAPGFIETRLTAAIPLAIREAGRRLSAFSQGGLPEDVAQAILFLASPGAQGVTGQTLRVCGGALIGA